MKEGIIISKKHTVRNYQPKSAKVSAGRRENGTGSITKRANSPYWQYTFSDPSTGRRISRSTGILADDSNKAKAARKGREIFVAWISEHPPQEHGKVTFREYCDKWLIDVRKPALKGKTYDTNVNTAQFQVYPYIGEMDIRRITPRDVQNMINALNNMGVSGSSIKKAKTLVSLVSKDAIVNGVISRSFADGVSIPREALRRKKPDEEKPYTEEEIRAILEQCSRLKENGEHYFQYWDTFVFIINTGMRIGELLGLRKSDIEIDGEGNRTIFVQRSVQDCKEYDESGKPLGKRRRVETTTKTYSSNRYVPLNKAANEALDSMLNRYPNSETIVCTKEGKPISRSGNLTRALHRLEDAAGVRRLGFHGFRHTVATTLAKNGVPEETISAVLGHHSSEVTRRIYDHYKRPTAHVTDVLDTAF